MSQFDLSKIRGTLARVPTQFQGKVAQVGFPKGITYPEDRGGASVAYIAAIQEFGAPERNIPPRPFMRPTVQEHRDEWVRSMGAFIPKVLRGQADAEDVLEAVGAQAAIEIQAQIAQVSSPALSPITVMLRKWRKDGKTITGKTVGEAAAAVKAGEDPGSDNKPLNDTGYMLASVRSAVNRVGGEFEV